MNIYLILIQDEKLPANFQCSSLVVDLDLHPKQNLVATGDIEGECMMLVYIYLNGMLHLFKTKIIIYNLSINN